MDSPPVSIREERGGGDLSRVKLLAERERERENSKVLDSLIGLLVYTGPYEAVKPAKINKKTNLWRGKKQPPLRYFRSSFSSSTNENYSRGGGGGGSLRSFSFFS